MHSRVCACRAGYTLGFAPLSSYSQPLIRRPSTDIVETLPHGALLARIEMLLCRFPENAAKINECRKTALRYRVSAVTAMTVHSAASSQLTACCRQIASFDIFCQVFLLKLLCTMYRVVQKLHTYCFSTNCATVYHVECDTRSIVQVHIFKLNNLSVKYAMHGVMKHWYNQ